MIVIVDYDAGNLKSVQRACKKVGMTALISDDPEKVSRADKVIFPGVGSAESAMVTLKDKGLDTALNEVAQKGRPVLGICLGLQILLDHTEEGNKDCLGLVGGASERFRFSVGDIKVPHIGWNAISLVGSHPMVENIMSGDQFYFVHSYRAKLVDEKEVIATTEYGDSSFCSILGKDNLFATQFHAEKSGELGLKIMKAFSDWSP